MEKLLEKFNNKKMIENIVIFIVLAIIVMIVINTLFEPKNNQQTETQTQAVFNTVESKKSKNEEERLAEILSQISGAGKVSVMISYLNDTENIPLIDTKITTTITNESDSSGGERKTEETSKEESVVYSEDSSTKSPVIRQKKNPEPIGVIVVAEGAGNLTVKENLINAVQAVIAVPSHRIQVFSK